MVNNVSKIYLYVQVYKGQEIGVITTPKHCNDGHVHVSMRKVNGGNKYIDFSKYMERRPMPKPQWIQECNHYMLMFLVCCKKLLFKIYTHTSLFYSYVINYIVSSKISYRN